MKNQDFVESLRASATEFTPPVRSLMDVDFYKFTMGQLILRHHGGMEVVFKLIVRDPTASVGHIVSQTELRKYLDYAMGLRFRKTDLYYLRGVDLYDKYMFKEEYLDFLRDFTLPPYQLRQVDGNIELTFRGPWERVSMWETIALAIISELYYRSVLAKIPKHELELVYVRAKDRIYTKLETLRRHPHIRFADFGQRRRHSFLWQEWVIGLCRDVMEEQFTGTSNAWMAFHHDLSPIGTHAHELPMVLAALANSDEEKVASQYTVLKEWEEMYGKALRIMLPDTFSSEQFFANAPEFVGEWRGMRQDSGDPFTRGHLYINWLRRRGIEAREKVLVFSEGLDVDQMVLLQEHFEGQIKTAFGWGTLLTNDFRNCHTGNQYLRPFSMVCKVVEANGVPCVKLSDNINKATGPVGEVERYKKIFGATERTSEVVLV